MIDVTPNLPEVVAEVRRELRERAVPVSAEAWRGALDDELAQLRPAAPRDLMRARLRARLEPQ